MIGAAASLLGNDTSASSNDAWLNAATRTRIHHDPPQVTTIDTSSSTVSSDAEEDLAGLTDLDDDNIAFQNSSQGEEPHPLPALGEQDSTLVEDFEKPALELLSLCQEVNAPLYLYDQITAILKRHHKNGFLDVNKMPGRDTLLRGLRKKLSPPVAYPHLVQTASGTVEVPKFIFLEQLRDLLGMTYFNSIENVCANREESQRFNKYVATPKDELLEVCSCDWYNRTYDQLGVAQRKRADNDDSEEVDQLLMPLIFYVDKTGTDVFQRYPLEPFMFTTAILRRDVRRKADSWRHLGFVPPVKGPESKKAINNIQSYHNCLKALLEDLVELQQHPPKLEVNLGGIKKVVYVRLPVAFVIGDQVSQDVLCGKRQSSTGASPRIHRSCMCSLLHCSINGKKDQSKHVGCKPIPLKAIKQLTLAVRSLPQLLEDGKHGLDVNEATRNDRSEIKLHKAVMRRRAEIATKILNHTLGLHPIDNAFNEVCFGSNDNGIHTATLNDIMHFNEGGLFLSLAQVAYGIIPPARRHDVLERSISRIFGNTRSSVRSDYPRGFFKSGFSDMTLLTSVEKVGVVFALLVALRVDDNMKSSMFQEGVVDSQDKYQSFPLGSSDVIKSDPEFRSKDRKLDPATAQPKASKQIGKKNIAKISVSQKTAPKSKNEGNKKITAKKENAELTDSNFIQSFPLTMATHFLRKKTRDNKTDKRHYPLTADVIKKVADHLKLHDLREILDVDLDALQLHHLMRDVWEVVQKLTEESYPTTTHEILSLAEVIPEIDETTVAVYAFVPPRVQGAERDPDYRESHFRLTYIEMFGLDLLKEQISAFDTEMNEDFLSMYDISSAVETSPSKRRKLSNHRSTKPVPMMDEIRTKPNGDMVLFAGSLQTAKKEDKSTPNASTKSSSSQPYFIMKHGREKKVSTTTRTFAVLSDVETFCRMLEVTLLHHAYLHYSETMEVAQRRDLSTLQRGIELHMDLVDKCVYRGDNTLDTATCKFHCHYQTTKVIPLYGDPSQYEAGSCERGLKTWAKKASRTAQKNMNVEVFSFQTASRVSDSQLLAKACDMTLSTTAPNPSRWINNWHKALAERSEQGSAARLAGNYFFARTKPHYRFDMKNRSVTRVCRKGKDIPGSSTRVLDAEIQTQILYAVQNFEDHEPVHVVEIWTELIDEEGKYLRATPLYPKLGPWYDWVMVHFERGGIDYFLPAKCILFYLDRNGEPSALIHGVGWEPVKNKSKSLLLTEWRKEYTSRGYAALTKVPISAIQRGILAFEVCPHDTPLNPSRIQRPEEIRNERVFVVSPRSSWASKFYNWCQENT